MRRAACVVALAGAIVTVGAASAQEAAPDSRWQAGLVQVLNWGAADTRAGDVVGLGLFATYRWNDRWSQTFGVDRFEYDLETPVLALSLGELSGDEAADSFITVLRLQSELEYHFRRGGRWDPRRLGLATTRRRRRGARPRRSGHRTSRIGHPEYRRATVRWAATVARRRVGPRLAHYSQTSRTTGDRPHHGREGRHQASLRRDPDADRLRF